MFNIIPPREPFVDNNGFITRVWWRFLNNLFMATGGGSITSSSDVEVLALQASVTHGTDYELQIGDIETVLAASGQALQGRVATLQNQVSVLTTILSVSSQALQGRIATLESQVAMLLIELKNIEVAKTDLVQRDRTLATLSAFTLGTH